MSEENVEVALETFRRFDAADFEAWAKLWHPQGRATAAAGWPEQGPFEGREAVVNQFKQMYENWSDYRFEDVEVVQTTGQWVVISWRLWTRGIGSGLESQVDLAVAMQIEDGQVVQGHFRWNADEALAAAGLRK